MNAITVIPPPVTLRFEWEWVWPMWRAIYPGCSGYSSRKVQP